MQDLIILNIITKKKSKSILINEVGFSQSMYRFHFTFRKKNKAYIISPMDKFGSDRLEKLIEMIHNA